MAVFKTERGETLVYGNSTNFDAGTANLYLCFQEDGRWQTVIEAIDGTPDTRFRLIPTNDDRYQFNILKIDSGHLFIQRSRVVRHARYG